MSDVSDLYDQMKLAVLLRYREDYYTFDQLSRMLVIPIALVKLIVRDLYLDDYLNRYKGNINEDGETYGGTWYHITHKGRALLLKRNKT